MLLLFCRVGLRALCLCTSPIVDRALITNLLKIKNKRG